MDFLDTAVSSIGSDPETAACAWCGQVWRPDLDDAVTAVRAAPRFYTDLLRAGDPYRVVPPATWSASAYTWHVADVCSAWAERAVALAREPQRPLAGFDQDELAAARNYAGMGAEAASWALEAAVARLITEVVERGRTDLPFHHPDWGTGTLADGLRWVAHELVHHEQDVRRSISAA